MRIHFPDIQIRVSIVNEVSTIREALEFEELGAVGVVLDRDVNRDIALLKDIRQQFKGEIELLCNSACVFHCINVHYHGTYSSAVTNSLFSKYNTTNTSLPTPYCNFYCRRRFFENPTELIKIHWIRPDDLQKYADMGINLFKIDGRDKEPRYIKTVIKAYLEGHYDGNLFHLLQPEFREDVQLIGKDVTCDPNNATPEELEQWTNEFLSESADWHMGISNHDLDGFSDAFFSGRVNCRGNCASCRYCEKYAKKVVIDPTWQRKIVKVMKYNLEQYYGKKQ